MKKEYATLNVKRQTPNAKQLPATRNFFFLAALLLFTTPSVSQQTLRLSTPGDLITAGILIPLNIGGSYLYTHKTPLTEEKIALLNVENINRFDRSATKNYSLSSVHTSDVLLIGYLAAPALLMLDKSMRSGAGIKSVIYLETLGVTAAEISFVKALVMRARPFVYKSDAPMREKLKYDANCSFFSGHTAMTAASSFYMASIISHVNGPQYDWVWFTAAVPPLLTGYFRYTAGKHFFTDIIVGFIVGSFNGYVVTQLHKSAE